MVYKVRGRADFFEEGDYNAACSMCGRKRKASQLVKNWMGQWRCPEHNEVRQPQDFVRGVQDIQSAPWVQEQTDINVQVCTYNGISAIAGLAVAGCMIAGRSQWDNEPVYVPIQYLTDDNGNFIYTDDGQLIIVGPQPSSQF